MTNRKQIDNNVLSLLKDREWLTNKIIDEKYSSSRLAKEIGTTRTTVEKYRVLHGIQQPLSQKELTTINYQNKTVDDKVIILEKRKETNKLLYGEENTFVSHQDKVKETMLDKYGVERALQSPEILEKQRQTMLDKYGVEFAMNNPAIKEKVKQMMIERYGVNNPGGLAEFVKKAQDTNIERYGHPHAMMNPEVALYAKQRFDEIYNTPEKLAAIQQKINNTCMTKYGVNHASQKHIPLENLKNLVNKDWLIEQHHTLKKTLTQIGNEVGCNITTVYRYCTINNVEIKYYYESAQQREISDWLQSLGIIVETNVRNKISGELDIYLPEYNLAIEYCGIFWHCDFHDRMTPTYHLNKLKQCQVIGIRLITLFEDEWVQTKEIVKQKILAILCKNTESIFARKCDIEVVKNNKIKQNFFNANHIQGDGPGSITYGLVYNNEYVAMMTFIKKPDGVYDLNRFASSIRVIGGFQKLLKHFKTNHDWKEILSFADLRWSEGNMYHKSGFKLDKILPQDYKYVIGNKTEHKFKFRRKSLEVKLENFDPLLSEVQNMRNHGFYRIFNCGLMRFVLQNN